jgi:hypothetical protein
MLHLQGKAAEEQMLEDAMSFIRASGEFRTVPDLARFLRIGVHDLDQQLNDWEDCGEIFSIQDETAGELFPVFGFDSKCGVQVCDAVSSPAKCSEHFVASIKQVS